MLPYNVKASNLKKANMSATNRPIIESNEPLVFKLKLSTRDKILACLNQCTQVFCGEKAKAALAKDNLMNDSANLCQALLNLPLKSDASTGSRPSRRVTLDLDSGTRSQITRTLCANQSLIAHVQSVSAEKKMKMVEQNNDLICKLAKLPLSTTTETANESALNDDDSEQKAEEDAKDAELVRGLRKKNTGWKKANTLIQGAKVVGKFVELAVELSAENELGGCCSII